MTRLTTGVHCPKCGVDHHWHSKIGKKHLTPAQQRWSYNRWEKNRKAAERRFNKHFKNGDA